MAIPTLNTNQFRQVPILGDLDLQIARSGVISGKVSPNQATALAAGTPVKLDSAITSGNVPMFVAAAQNDLAIGFVKRTLQSFSFNTGDVIEVVSFFGPVMWLLPNTTIAPGTQVENSSDGTTVQPFTSHSVRGIQLDPGVVNVLARVIITNAAAAHA